MGVPCEVEWVNHASFVFRRGASNLLCDPWLDGTAFKDGWQLIARSKFRVEDFAGIDRLWISHQHPDHFAPLNLKAIEPEIRRRMTVYYQDTPDKLVVNWCKSTGFGKVVELPLRSWYRMSEDFDVMCGTVDHDSWLAMRTPECTLLNVNDCVLKQEERIRDIASLVGPVNVLFTQFSYAQWTGNPWEQERRRHDALEKYERIRLQDALFNPSCIVPFASFVYFCHEENFSLNDGMNRVGDVAEFIERDLKKAAVVLYPGERWNPPERIDWRPAARQYSDDLDEKLSAGPTHFRRSTPVSQVEAQANAFIERLRRKNRRAQHLIRERATVYLTDSLRGYEVSIDGLRACDVSESEANIATSGENLLYAFRTPWGGNTLHVSGRFTSASNGYRQFFALMRKLHHYNVTRVDVQWVLRMVKRVALAVPRRLMRALAVRPRRAA